MIEATNAKRSLVRSPVIAALIGLSLTGCSLQAPKPWQKEALARSEMTMAGDPLESRYAEHISASKQAPSGGSGVGGGGCGCN